MTGTELPHWVELHTTAESALARCNVAADLACFAGHFPEQPLLPGVLQLHWAVELAARVWPAEFPAEQYSGSARLKFKAPVLPGQELAFELAQIGSGPAQDTVSAEPQRRRRIVKVQIHCDQQTVTSGLLHYRYDG